MAEELDDLAVEVDGEDLDAVDGAIESDLEFALDAELDDVDAELDVDVYIEDAAEMLDEDEVLEEAEALAEEDILEQAEELAVNEGESLDEALDEVVVDGEVDIETGEFDSFNDNPVQL